MQAAGLNLVLFEYTTSRTQGVPLRLLESYRDFVMTNAYAAYHCLALQPCVERLACIAHALRRFVNV